MKLVFISDTHNFHKQISVPYGDVLIHAGDSTGMGSALEVTDFLSWLHHQPHKHKILIAGNHDWLFQKTPGYAQQLLDRFPSITYLEDTGRIIDGVLFYGSPWQPWFHDWAFNLQRGADLAAKWAQIPEDTHVLITHGPPHGILDTITPAGLNLGCEALRDRVKQLPELKYHVFGHIHGGYGVQSMWNYHTDLADGAFINASICNEAYQPVNPPFEFTL